MIPIGSDELGSLRSFFIQLSLGLDACTLTERLIGTPYAVLDAIRNRLLTKELRRKSPFGKDEVSQNDTLS